MGLKEKIKSILAGKAMTMTFLAKEMTNRRGKRMALNNLSTKLKNETVTFKELKMIADIVGFDIEFIERQ